ncbi:MAG TPA: molecular chaperone DnaK, partial [Veillonellaceae bacterium]|nr:molecular chaperone DnaK [Veillonellaceae bacterium]
MSYMSSVVGIGLGTTNSVDAVMEGVYPLVFRPSEGLCLTPSEVGSSQSGERLVGQLLTATDITTTRSTVVSIKTNVGM